MNYSEIDIIKKLIGPFHPVGKTEIDNERFENLKILCDVVNDLTFEIDQIAKSSIGHQEYSIKRSGDYARNFLKNLYPDK